MIIIVRKQTGLISRFESDRRRRRGRKANRIKKERKRNRLIKRKKDKTRNTKKGINNNLSKFAELDNLN